MHTLYFHDIDTIKLSFEETGFTLIVSSGMEVHWYPSGETKAAGDRTVCHNRFPPGQT